MDDDVSGDTSDLRQEVPAGPQPRARRPDRGDDDSWQDNSWDDLRFTGSEDEADRWAWLSEQPEEPTPPDLAHCTVTAVLVTLDAEAWLPETLSALSRLSYRPTRLIAVDNGSTDSTVELLERAHRHGLLDLVVAGPKIADFGAGVAAAMSELSDPDVAMATPGSDNSAVSAMGRGCQRPAPLTRSTARSSCARCG